MQWHPESCEAGVGGGFTGRHLGYREYQVVSWDLSSDAHSPAFHIVPTTVLSGPLPNMQTMCGSTAGGPPGPHDLRKLIALDQRERLEGDRGSLLLGSLCPTSGPKALGSTTPDTVPPRPPGEGKELRVLLGQLPSGFSVRSTLSLPGRKGGREGGDHSYIIHPFSRFSIPPRLLGQKR